MAYCEDYPCCGHTPSDPCDVQWYDAPDAFDTSVNPHALCEHEDGFCYVDEDDDEREECDACGGRGFVSVGGGENFATYPCSACHSTGYVDERDYAGGEDAWLDGSYEE